MAFFDPPPPPSEPSPEPTYRTPEWGGPPSNWLGMPVDLRVLLGRTSTVLVAAMDFQAYPTGVRFNLSVRTQGAGQTGRDVLRSLHGVDDNGAEQGLRLGVKTAQGRAFNYDQMADRAPDPPAPPYLANDGGSGGRREFVSRYWLWPLPPPGAFEMACEWRAMSIDESVASVDGDRIRAAAQNAVEVWPDDGTGDAGFGSYWIDVPRI